MHNKTFIFRSISKIYPIFPYTFLNRLFDTNEDLSTSFRLCIPFSTISSLTLSLWPQRKENETITRFLEMKVNKNERIKKSEENETRTNDAMEYLSMYTSSQLNVVQIFESSIHTIMKRKVSVEISRFRFRTKINLYRYSSLSLPLFDKIHAHSVTRSLALASADYTTVKVKPNEKFLCTKPKTLCA